MKTIRIETRNNADARRMGAYQVQVPGARDVRHNGGKTVIVTVDDPALAAVIAWCDEAREVASYEVQG